MAPPRKARINVHPSGARPGNFTLLNVTAMTARVSIAGTTKPKPFSACGTSSRRNARLIVADEA
jgi:hypothetical protein